MEQARKRFAGLSEPQKKIVMAAGVMMVAMLVFPPMAVVFTNPLIGTTQSAHLGYYFALSNPTAVPGLYGGVGFDNPYVYARIEWLRLAVQLAVVAAGAFMAIRGIADKSALSHATP